MVRQVQGELDALGRGAYVAGKHALRVGAQPECLGHGAHVFGIGPVFGVEPGAYGVFVGRAGHTVVFADHGQAFDQVGEDGLWVRRWGLDGFQGQDLAGPIGQQRGLIHEKRLIGCVLRVTDTDAFGVCIVVNAVEQHGIPVDKRQYGAACCV